uniref:Uncharacterized protein n=1 Tax=Arundo donax TaxID=35708 RepID=A0A0A9ACM0_ARUDO
MDPCVPNMVISFSWPSQNRTPREIIQQRLEYRNTPIWLCLHTVLQDCSGAVFGAI